MSRLIKRRTDGTYKVSIGANEREFIASMLPQLRELIEGRESVAWRLFPNAYVDDPEKAAEYEEMVGSDLRTRRLNAITTVEATIESTSLSEEDLMAWMGAVNDLRLVLGTRLDVTEESEIDDFDNDTEQALFTAYSYLGYVLEEIVASL